VSTPVDRTLAALADPTRRAVVGMLSKGPRRPSEIAGELSTTRPAMSRHLRVLRKAGIVREELQADDARVRVYELCPEPFVELRAWLEGVETFWADQLDAFKRHAEKRRSRRKP
jgi:DNA-binding transcriptional ArsR family regulator